MLRTFNNRSQSFLRFLGVALAALFIQITVLPFIAGIPILDLFAAVLVAFAFQQNINRLGVVAVAGGIFIDIFSALNPVGISALLYGAVIVGAYSASHVFHVRTFSLPAVLIIIMTLTALHGIQRLLLVEAGIDAIDLIGTSIIGIIATALLLRS